MEFVYTDGCIVSGLTVDGKNYDDCGFTLEQKREFAKKLVDRLGEGDLDNEIMDLIQTVGDYEYLYTCEECGDSVSEWRTEL